MRYTRRAFLQAASALPLAAADKPLNFVFILIDDYGWTDTGYNGSTFLRNCSHNAPGLPAAGGFLTGMEAGPACASFYETPHIDRLAREGMRFTNGYSACPVCSPTRAAIMTGKYPARLGLTSHLPGGHIFPYSKLLPPEVPQQLALEEVTIAEALKTKGYRTASIGKWHMGGEGFLPTSQGFDVNFAGTFRGSPRSFFYPQWGDNPPIQAPEGAYLTDLLTDEAVKWLRANAQRPFFLYLPHYAVHVPIEAKTALIARYAAKSRPENPQNFADYAAMIQSVDESVGRILETLEELGVSSNTAVFFTADNGGVTSLEWKNRPVTSNLPLRVGKGHLYEGGIRVPTVVKWPGVARPGSVSHTPVSSIDYHPTIVEMAGIRPQAAYDGVSITSLLKGGRIADRDLFWHYPHYSPQLGKPGAVIRRGDYKLIRFYEDDHHELYNLRDDIGESNELAAKMPELAARMRRRLDDWLRSVHASMMRPNPASDPARSGERSAPARAVTTSKN
ncbi:MAG: sulfatase [Acidobacteria bacterium]|nr:sulfatase [Acidobacteriota bacterium]